MKRFRIAGIAGLVAPPLVFACILTAIASWPQFNWFNNALSDLGVQNGATSIVFNSGLIIGGLIFIIFATGLFNFAAKNGTCYLGSTFFILAALMLIAIGVFNENFSPTHYLLSIGLFVFLPISLLTLTAAYLLAHRFRLAAFTLASAIVAAAIWAFEFAIKYAPGVAIPEFVSGLAGAVWVIGLSYLMLMQSRDK